MRIVGRVIDGLFELVAEGLLDIVLDAVGGGVDVVGREAEVFYQVGFPQAMAADQAAVQKVLGQLQEGLKLHGEPTIKFYPLEPAQAAAATDLLATLVPKAKAKYDATREQMSVVATTKEHAKVAQALTDFQAGARPPVRPELVVYPIAADLRPRIIAAAVTSIITANASSSQVPGTNSASRPPA